MNILNKEFDPFNSVVAVSADVKEFVIMTKTWSEEEGYYWVKSVTGFKSMDDAEQFIQDRKEEVELEELCQNMYSSNIIR